MTSLFMVTSIHSIKKKTPQETARNSQKNVRLEDKGRFKDQKRGIKLRLKKCLTKKQKKSVRKKIWIDALRERNEKKLLKNVSQKKRSYIHTVKLHVVW